MNNTDDKIIASAIESNKSLFENFIIEKNQKAGALIRTIHEIGDDHKFHELGNYSKGKLENIYARGETKALVKEYVKIHLDTREIINETVCNNILQIKK